MKIIPSLTIVLCLLLAGCSNISPGGYYWGKYSYTYHDLLKNPSDSTRAAHEKTLRDIIEKSEAKNLRTPPGIHAELGHLLTKAGKANEAQSQYQAEKRLYPESEIFLQRLLSEQRDGDKG